MESLKKPALGARGIKRTGIKPVQNLSNMDRDLANNIAVLRKNKAFVKSADGKPTKVSDTTLYIAADAQGFSGIQPIMDSNTKKLVGITNFDGNKLNTGKAFIVSKARLLYTTSGDSLTKADWQNQTRPVVADSGAGGNDMPE